MKLNTPPFYASLVAGVFLISWFLFLLFNRFTTNRAWGDKIYKTDRLSGKTYLVAGSVEFPVLSRPDDPMYDTRYMTTNEISLLSITPFVIPPDDYSSLFTFSLDVHNDNPDIELAELSLRFTEPASPDDGGSLTSTFSQICFIPPFSSDSVDFCFSSPISNFTWSVHSARCRPALKTLTVQSSWRY